LYHGALLPTWTCRVALTLESSPNVPKGKASISGALSNLLNKLEPHSEQKLLCSPLDDSYNLMYSSPASVFQSFVAIFAQVLKAEA